MVPDRFWVLAAACLSIPCGLELMYPPSPSSSEIATSSAPAGARLRPLEPGARVTGFVGRSFNDGSEERIEFDGERRSLVFVLGENCIDCRVNVPQWNALRRAAEGRARVFGVAVGSYQKIEMMLSDAGAEFTVLRFPSEDVMRAYGAFAFPQTLLIEADGTVSEVVLGALDEEEVGSLARGAVDPGPSKTGASGG